MTVRRPLIRVDGKQGMVGDTDVTALGSLNLAGHLRFSNPLFISGTYVIGPSDEDTLLFLTSTEKTYVTIPASSGNSGRLLIFKDSGGIASTNLTIIYPNGSELIDGATDLTINANYTALVLICDGVGWRVLVWYWP